MRKVAPGLYDLGKVACKQLVAAQRVKYPTSYVWAARMPAGAAPIINRLPAPFKAMATQPNSVFPDILAHSNWTINRTHSTDSGWHKDNHGELAVIALWANVAPTLIRDPHTHELFNFEAGHIMLFDNTLYEHHTPWLSRELDERILVRCYFREQTLQ